MAIVHAEPREHRVEDLLKDAIAAARLCDAHPDMTAVSAHLLGCGQRA